MENTAILLITEQDGVRTLTLNRPEKRNALNTPLLQAVLDALDAADHDAGIGAIVLAGAGAMFSAGADMGEFRDAGSHADAASEYRGDLLLALQLRFGSLGKPVIAAVNGAAIGAGAALALAADMIVLGGDARIGYPETRHGMVPSLAMPTLLRQTGRRAAFELLVTAELIDAQRALELGLANRVVAAQEVAAEAQRLAARLASMDRQAIADTKRVFNACADLPLADALREGRAWGKKLKAERSIA